MTHPFAPSDPHHLRRFRARSELAARDAQQLQLLRLGHGSLQSHVRERNPGRVPEPGHGLDHAFGVPLRLDRHVQTVVVVARVAARYCWRRCCCLGRGRRDRGEEVDVRARRRRG